MKTAAEDFHFEMIQSATGGWKFIWDYRSFFLFFFFSFLLFYLKRLQFLKRKTHCYQNLHGLRSRGHRLFLSSLISAWINRHRDDCTFLSPERCHATPRLVPSIPQKWSEAVRWQFNDWNKKSQRQRSLAGKVENRVSERTHRGSRSLQSQNPNSHGAAPPRLRRTLRSN